MSSGQRLTDLNTYWINFNDTNGTRKKKCKESSKHKTFTNPTYINRVKCVTDTLNSIAKNNTPRIHLLDTKQYRKGRERVFPLTGQRRKANLAAVAAAANNVDDQEEEEEEEENNNASPAASPVAKDGQEEEEENNNASPPAPPSAAAPASASAPASAPASASSAAAPPRLPRSIKAKEAAAAAAALLQFKKENPPKKINDIFNGNTLKTVSNLIKDKCFSTKAEFDKVPITLSLLPKGISNKKSYTILFDSKPEHNGNRYILKEEDNESFSIQEISSKSVVKVGSGRRKTQKKNKHKKRTTSKRR